MPSSSTGFAQKSSRYASIRHGVAVLLQKPSTAKLVRRWGTVLVAGLIIAFGLSALVPVQQGYPSPNGQSGQAVEIYTDDALLEAGRDLPDEITAVPSPIHWRLGLSKSRLTAVSCTSTNHFEKDYSFQMLEPGSGSYESNSRWCPGLEQPSAKAQSMRPLDGRFNFLLILGAQKAGTTWLFDALDTHPLFVGATHGYRRGKDKWRKEVHFFDQWPLGTSADYINCFPQDRRVAALSGKHPAVFVDASPEYLLTPAAAPRAAQIIPHAKLVIVLRDPVARSLSAWRMVERTICPPNKPELYNNCSLPSFYSVVAKETSAVDVGLPTQCMFNTADPMSPKSTWADCWHCLHSIPKFMCKRITDHDKDVLGGCPPTPPLPTTHVSLYAAQIAWWLSFFPPDRFLILKSSDLHNPSTAMEALNKVLQHVGMDLDIEEPFSQEQIANISGFQGNYSHELFGDDLAAAQNLAAFYAEPNRDLQTLMDTYFPSADFHGFESEFGL